MEEPAAAHMVWWAEDGRWAHHSHVKGLMTTYAWSPCVVFAALQWPRPCVLLSADMPGGQPPKLVASQLSTLLKAEEQQLIKVHVVCVLSATR